jgi:hypothetical protein
VIKGVGNVWVPVEDVERALDFYQNTLGFSVIKQDGPWAEVDANGLNIGLNGREPEVARARSIACSAVRVTMALTSGLTRSICARCASMTSRADSSFARTRRTSSVAVRKQILGADIVSFSLCAAAQ